MSRRYGVEVEISLHNESDVTIISAIGDEWPFTQEDGWVSPNWVSPNGAIRCYAEGNLGGGEDEYQLTERIASAAMRANRKPCRVVVTTTLLENLPTDVSCFDKKDFKRLMKRKEAR